MAVSTSKSASGVATRQRLLEAAEELFSEHGFDRVSVRDVTEKAGANVAAVNYHFGSREGLIEQVIERYVNPVNEERIARLEAVERRAGGRPVPLEEILDAFVRPFATQVRKSELSEKLFYKLMARIAANQTQVPARVQESFMRMIERFRRAFGKALPTVPSDELLWRIHFTIGAMVHTMAHAEMLTRMTRGEAGSPSMDATLARFIRFAAAGLRQGELPSIEVEDDGSQSEFLF